MKPRPTTKFSRTASHAGTLSFTLAETLIATAILGLVLLGIVYSHVFGLKMATLTNSELTTTQDARKALNRVREEIRSARMVYLYKDVTFAPIPLNNPQVGNALKICPTLDPDNYVLYYLDDTDHSLKRTASGSDQIEVIAGNITNQMVFSAEDSMGQVLTNDRNNRVIGMTLDFSPEAFRVARVGGETHYDSYHLQTKVTPRVIE
jgi:type II secretory pathway pseudopilin PulG